MDGALLLLILSYYYYCIVIESKLENANMQMGVGGVEVLHEYKASTIYEIASQSSRFVTQGKHSCSH
jgi:hypothetical protein